MIAKKRWSAYNGAMKKSVSDGEQQFTDYVQRMKRIRHLSSPTLDELNTADAYSDLLFANFKQIGTLAGENRALISTIVAPLLESTEVLSEQHISDIASLHEQLLDATEAESFDLPMAQQISDRLMQDAERKHDESYLITQMDKEIENNYLLQNMTQRITTAPEIAAHFHRTALAALEKILGYLDKERFIKLNYESRESVLINSRYGAALYENFSASTAEAAEKKLAFLKRALTIMEDPFYMQAMPDSFDWRYHKFRIYEYIALTDTRALSQELKDFALKYARLYKELWLSDAEYFKDLSARVEMLIIEYSAEYYAGAISCEAYQEAMFELFLTRNEHDYSSAGMMLNLKIPASYLETMHSGRLTEQEKAGVEKLEQASIAYMFHMPKLGLLSTSLEYYTNLLLNYIEIPGGMTFEEMALRSLAALHPPTYIHSRMVAYISRCLTEHLLEKKPELFVGICGCTSACNANEHATQISAYAYHAALCHDVGKLMLIDTIFVYGRKLLDMEFEIIRQHPEMGALLLSRNESTKAYADVARGHHLWYDGSKGYPQHFNAAKSPYKTIIDIVTCADCMDAATDTVGRSYNQGKTFADFSKEVQEGAGTRYAPYFPKLFADKAVADEISYLLSAGRKSIYRETYMLLRNVQDKASLQYSS